MATKGLLLTNSFLRTEKFVEHYDWLEKAAGQYQITLDLWENAEMLAAYGMSDHDSTEQETAVTQKKTFMMSELSQILKDYRFVIFWDKDIRMGDALSDLCRHLQIPIYNSVEAVAVCDDKSETYRRMQLWNELLLHQQEQIPLLPTIVAPMTYSNVAYTKYDFLGRVADVLGLPMVIKECFGSFGQQVYLVKNEQELRERTEALAGTPFLYQKYLSRSHGHDVRLQVVGNRVVAAMHRYSENGDFRANLTNGGQMESYVPSEQECALAVRTVRALGLDFAGVDLLFSKGLEEEADVVCEVNSNAHFRNIAECTGVNVAEKIMGYIVSWMGDYSKQH